MRTRTENLVKHGSPPTYSDRSVLRAEFSNKLRPLLPDVNPMTRSGPGPEKGSGHGREATLRVSFLLSLFYLPFEMSPGPVSLGPPCLYSCGIPRSGAPEAGFHRAGPQSAVLVPCTICLYPMLSALCLPREIRLRRSFHWGSMHRKINALQKWYARSHVIGA